MKLSVVVATRNRAYAIAGCLDSIAAAIAYAGPVDAEIVVVDNGSTDDTGAVIKAWAAASAVPVQLLSEPNPGLSSAHNRALRNARGDLLAFTDDDCRLSKEYISQLLRYDAADTGLVLRGGRIELGDPTDLPLTIYTAPSIKRWSREDNSARHECLSGHISGCNMTMRRALVDRVGIFDEGFGSGARIGSGGDTDYIYRAYLADVTLEYVPDMTVFHYHGRKTNDVGQALLRSYSAANGGLYARYLFKHPNLCRPFYWDCKNALREIITGTNTFPARRNSLARIVARTHGPSRTPCLSVATVTRTAKAIFALWWPRGAKKRKPHKGLRRSWQHDSMVPRKHGYRETRAMESSGMALILAMLSQKGGVGKSTLARLLACEFAGQGWNVKIADLDISQGTSFQWRARRLQNQIEPDVPVEQFGNVAKALALADQYDMLILDGEPHATSSTRAAALSSHLTVIPTGLSLDDLPPAVVLAHDLVKQGLPRQKIVFALCRVGESAGEIEEGRTYLQNAGYDVLPGAIPEKTAYRRATDAGRALTNTRFLSLNQRAEEVVQGVVDRISQLADAGKKKRSIA